VRSGSGLEKSVNKQIKYKTLREMTKAHRSVLVATEYFKILPKSKKHVNILTLTLISVFYYNILPCHGLNGLGIECW
jgi:hypothetical protein